MICYLVTNYYMSLSFSETFPGLRQLMRIIHETVFNQHLNCTFSQKKKKIYTEEFAKMSSLSMESHCIQHLLSTHHLKDTVPWTPLVFKQVLGAKSHPQHKLKDAGQRRREHRRQDFMEVAVFDLCPEG